MELGCAVQLAGAHVGRYDHWPFVHFATVPPPFVLSCNWYPALQLTAHVPPDPDTLMQLDVPYNTVGDDVQTDAPHVGTDQTPSWHTAWSLAVYPLSHVNMHTPPLATFVQPDSNVPCDGAFGAFTQLIATHCRLVMSSHCPALHTASPFGW
jgi:hypothetical protein